QGEIDILENATRGLLGLGRRRARVRATIRAPFILAPVPTPVPAAAPASTAISDGAPPLTTRSAATPTTAPDAEFDVAAFLAGALQRMGVTARVRAAAVVDGACALTIDGANEHEQQAWTKALDAERGVRVQPTSDGARRKLIIVPEGRRRGGGTADD